MLSAIHVLLCATAAFSATAIVNLRCSQEISRGPCLAYKPRYGFDTSTGQCVRFIYGGCGGNSNRFLTKRECERACMWSRGQQVFPGISLLPIYPDSEPVCTLPLDKGPCFGYIQRYGFDAEIGKCVMFIYGGCQGNGNNFETEEECQLSCLANTPMPIMPL